MIEALRRAVVTDALSLDSVSACWPIWQPKLRQKLQPVSALRVLDLGDSLSETFLATRGSGGRDQSALSGGGTAWEALVCWYLNLCLIGTNAIVCKKPSDTPMCIREALRVTYANNVTNSESDLVAFSFPDDLSIVGGDSLSRASLTAAVDAIAARHFEKLRVAVLQCKTNWNDNAQIPMLWDMVYHAEDFKEHRIKVGTSRYSLSHLASFRYSFVTVPTQSQMPREGSTAVARVMNLSGGNYWGRPTATRVAESLKELFAKTHIGPASGRDLKDSLTGQIGKLDTAYSYFQL